MDQNNIKMDDDGWTNLRAQQSLYFMSSVAQLRDRYDPSVFSHIKTRQFLSQSQCVTSESSGGSSLPNLNYLLSTCPRSFPSMFMPPPLSVMTAQLLQQLGLSPSCHEAPWLQGGGPPSLPAINGLSPWSPPPIAAWSG